MLTLIESKTCPICGTSLSGRSDKKYCSDKCRNIYSNNLRSKSKHFNSIRNINNALIVNRNVLSSLCQREDPKVSFNTLSQMGFNFKYHTHTYQTKAGKVYNYSYDYGYLALENDNYLIVRAKE